MARFRMVGGISVPFTQAEEDAKDAEIAAYDPIPNLVRKLLVLQRERVILQLLEADTIRINNMNEAALRAAIEAGGL